MEIVCAECGNTFFTKQIKLKMLKGQDEVIEEVYYVCSCGLAVAKKDIKNFPVHENEILLYKNRD